MSPTLSTTIPVENTSTAHDFWQLLKPRVMSLVVFTGWAGLVGAPQTLHPVLYIVTLLCIALGAGSAGAFNMWFDRDIDAVMQRTQNRPVPAGRINPDNALAFAIIINVFATLFLGLAVSWAAAIWLAFATFIYVVIYTMWLKRRTPHNIVIGGLAGALPPVIGWAASSADMGLSLEPWLLCAIIFLWTPPHFWAIALFANADYKKAGVPMLPVTHGEASTRHHILVYGVLVAIAAPLPSIFGQAGMVYGGASSILGLLFLASSWRCYATHTHAAARLLFGYSILFLFLLFGFYMIDRWI
jgi:heme o synthase